MIKGLRNLLLLLLFVAASSVLVSSCKKDSDEDTKPETAATLKSRVVGKWQLVKGVMTEYDAAGKIVRQEDFSRTDPVPLYDFRDNDMLFVTDFRGEKKFFYTVSIPADGRFRMLIDSADDYTITSVNQTDMKWFQEQKVPEGQPGTTRRAVVEIEFKKL
jgi:predicted peptidase